MKIGGTHFQALNNTGKISPGINNARKAEAAGKARKTQTVTANRQKPVLKFEKTNENDGLRHLLSSEEKNMFDLLFPANESQAAGSPSRLYPVSNRYGVTTQQSYNKILGNQLDIRG